jgi:hypothetical protein
MNDLWPATAPSIEGEVDSFHGPLERRGRMSPHRGWVSGPAERETW